MAIKCCNGCVPPKRNPYCHCEGNCPEWEAAKAKHDMEKAEDDRRKAIQRGLIAQALRRVDRAQKERKRKEGK